ncbi:MAG: thioesterase family protein [Pseudomonadota bacterium]
MVHIMDIKIRGYHLDLFGHVNDARYFEFLEEARWRAFEKTVDLMELHRKGYTFTVVNININYCRAAVIDEVLTIETEVTQWGEKSAVIRQLVKHKNTDILVAEATVTFMIIDSQKQEAVLLEGELLELLRTI